MLKGLIRGKMGRPNVTDKQRDTRMESIQKVMGALLFVTIFLLVVYFLVSNSRSLVGSAVEAIGGKSSRLKLDHQDLPEFQRSREIKKDIHNQHLNSQIQERELMHQEFDRKQWNQKNADLMQQRAGETPAQRRVRIKKELEKRRN